MILLVLAFFIYWIFSPSWAARLWYNVRTFPQRVTSWISSGSEFLDYDSYKLDVSDIWDKIWDKIGLGDDNKVEDLSSEDEIEVNTTEVNSEDTDEKIEETENQDVTTEKKSIKKFPKSVKFIEIPDLKVDDKQENKTEIARDLTWYSKSDLLWVINKYVERNLDDDTNILVTVEYEDDSSDPQKIVLQTQSKDSLDASLNVYDVSSSNSLLNKLFDENNSKK